MFVIWIQQWTKVIRVLASQVLHQGKYTNRYVTIYWNKCSKDKEEGANTEYDKRKSFRLEGEVRENISEKGHIYVES